MRKFITLCFVALCVTASAADEIRLSTRATGDSRITTPARAGEFPYVVPYPLGLDKSVVARQYEENGDYADLNLSGGMTLHSKDGGLIGQSPSVSDKCRAKQGKPPCPRRALAKLYAAKYGPPPAPPVAVRPQPFSF